MHIQARHLDQAHYGQHVKVAHVDGLLRVAKRSGLVVEILAEAKDGSLQGVRVAGNEPVEMEKTLENQVRDDFKNISDQVKTAGFGLLRKIIK